MSTQTKVPQLPAIPKGVDSETRRWMESVKQVIEVREGTRGKSLDQSVTFRDLMDVDVDISMLGIKGGPKPGSGATGVVGDGVTGAHNVPDLPPIPYCDVPPTPTGLKAFGGVGLVFIRWDNPRETYSNHAFTEIQRSKSANFAQAGLLGTAFDFNYTDILGEVNEEDSDGLYYYWVRWMSTSNTPGPYAGPVAAGDVYAILTNRIKRSHLYETLSSTIDLIDGDAGLEGSVASRIIALDTEITGPDGAIAKTEQQWTTKFDGQQQTIDVTAKSVDGLKGQYTVKIETDNNGKKYIAGFGLASHPSEAGAQTSEFIVRADNFAMVMPGYDDFIPFVIGTVGGVAKVTMTSAAIGDATIGNVHIDRDGIDAQHIRSGTIVAGQKIYVGNSHFVLETKPSASGSYGQLKVADNSGKVRVFLGYFEDEEGTPQFGLQVKDADGNVQFDVDGARVLIDQAFINDLWIGGFKATVPAGSFTYGVMPLGLNHGEQTTIQMIDYDPQDCPYVGMQLGVQYKIHNTLEIPEGTAGFLKLFIAIYPDWKPTVPLWYTEILSIKLQAADVMGATPPLLEYDQFFYASPTILIPSAYQNSQHRYTLKLGVNHYNEYNQEIAQGSFNSPQYSSVGYTYVREVWNRSMTFTGLRSYGGTTDNR